mgnify:CR=1 FL=1
MQADLQRAPFSIHALEETTELVLADLEAVRKKRNSIAKDAKRGDKEAIAQEEVLAKIEPVLDEGKPERILDRIVEGKLTKFYEEICLMEQPFIKDGDVKVSDLVTQMIAKLGENIVIRRFVRYQVGE